MMPRILVVEDDPDAREMLAVLLKCAGYGVITAENALDALVRAAAEAPALIITDLERPGLNGVEMIGRLRADGTQLGGVPTPSGTTRARCLIRNLPWLRVRKGLVSYPLPPSTTYGTSTRGN